MKAGNPFCSAPWGRNFDFSFGTRLRAIDVAYAAPKTQERRPEINKTRLAESACRGLHSTRHVLEHLRARSGPSTMRLLSVALALSSVAALQPPASRATAAKANPAAVDLYSRATTASAARDVALYGMFGPSEAEKRAEQARIDAEQEALNEKFRKESESDFAFMSVFGVVTCVGSVLGMCLRV